MTRWTSRAKSILAPLVASAAMAQIPQLSKEYVRVNGQLLAIEAQMPPFAVAPSSVTAILPPGQAISFSATRAANWSIVPTGVGAMSLVSTTAGQQTTYTVPAVIPPGVTQIWILANEQGGTGFAQVQVQLIPPISIQPIPGGLSPGGQAQFAANIPVTWEVSPPGAATVSPATTTTSQLTTLTIGNPPTGNPPSITVTARDARAQTNPAFAGNYTSIPIAINYPSGAPSASGGYSSSWYNGPAAALWQFYFSDPQGPQNINWMAFNLSPSGPQQASSCALYVYSNGFAYLWDNAGTSVTSGMIGDDTQLRNSQCLIDMRGLRLFDQGGFRTLEIPLYVTPAFASSPRNIWLAVGNNQGQVQPGTWSQVGNATNLFFSTTETTLAVHPNPSSGVTTQLFHASAMSLNGYAIPYMNLAVQEPGTPGSGNSCAVWLYRDVGWAYLMTNNPYSFDSSQLSNSSYVLNTQRCSAPVSSIRMSNYQQQYPGTPYEFMSAGITANSLIRGTTQYLIGYANYATPSGWMGESIKYLGWWAIPF